jgi:hypothetical protein
VQTLIHTETPAAPPDDGARLEGYDQETVEDFVHAVARERDRLHAELVHERERERRALVVVRMHEMMLVSMRTAYADVTATRHEAERQTAEILRDAVGRAGTVDVHETRLR